MDFQYFWGYYCKSAQYLWYNMQPMHYGIILIVIAVAGYILMKSGADQY